jgi:hypothetical protein
MIAGNDRSRGTKFQAGPGHSHRGVKVIKYFLVIIVTYVNVK